MHAPIYILGGSQTDFARNWAREELEIYDLFAEALQDAVQVGVIEPVNPGLGMLKFCDATNTVIGDRISRQVQCLIHRRLRPFNCAAIGTTA